MSSTPTFLEQAKNPCIVAAYRYWRGKADLCPAGRLPGRGALDPHEMRPFLQYVVLYDVERAEGGLRFRYRLAGTHLYELFGADVTGQYIGHFGTPHLANAAVARFTQVIETRAPVYGVSPVPAQLREYMSYEHATMPLASDGVTVDMLFGVRCALAER